MNAVGSRLLTRSTEDYLKAIYSLGGDAGLPVQTAAIADALGVAAPSVSGMLRRLAEAGFLEHIPYRGVRLTDDGRRVALRMVRRHRILESYLTSKLGFDWDSVHDEAERMEHAVSDDLIERMAQVLGSPSYDPHGAPIPTPAGEVEELKHVPLAELGVGQWGELRMVSDKDPERLRFLKSVGLEVGTRFQVIERQPFNGPVTIRVAGRQPQPLGNELARSLGCAARETEGAA